MPAKEEDDNVAKLQFGLSLCAEVGRWTDTKEQAIVAEELGYDSVWIPEHHFMEAGYGPAPLVTLAALASVTGRVKLGTDVLIAPLYHPVRLAEETAWLHELSGGRLIVGAALGYRPDEFEAFGIPFKRRREYLEDAMALLPRLWTEENVTFHGSTISVKDLTITPRVDPRPELWLGGWVEAAVDRAARLADVWFPGPTADREKMRWCWATYDDALARHGRKRLRRPLFREIWVGRTQAEIDIGRRHLEEIYNEDYRAWGHDNVGAGDVFADRFFVGSPDEVVEQINDWRQEFGFDQLIGRMHFHRIDQRDVLRSMQVFAEDVMPKLA